VNAARPALAELPLFLWLSPAFPVGAFAYSHALEWGAETGDVSDFSSFLEWLSGLLLAGGPRNDAILFAEAYGAALSSDWQRLLAANALALALCSSVERRLETSAQGNAFVAAASEAWSCIPLREIESRRPQQIAYPIAVAATCAGHNIELESGLRAFVLSGLANLVSSAVRLSVIGQSGGQKALAELAPRVVELAREARGSTLDYLGGAALRSDIAAMRHETQYSRLFRS
jgi:urease accessory protein